MDKFYLYLLTHRIPKMCSRWCEKTPKNVQFFGRILEYFKDNVKIIHIIRDGRDVVTSRHPTKKSEFWVSPSRWVNDVTAGLKFESHPQVFTLKYEDLAMSPEETLRKLCAFIEEKYEANIMSFYDRTSIKKDKAWSEEVKPIHQDSVGKWKRPEFKERVESFMKDEPALKLMQRLRYI